MSNARNLAKLQPNASGQIPDANLAGITASKLSGTLPDSVAPNGTVIQVSRVTSTSYITWSSTNWIDLWVNSFTPNLPNSTLYFIVEMNFLPEASNTHDVWMDWRGLNGEYSYNMSKASGITGWQQVNATTIYSAPSGGTSQANLRIQVRGNGSNTSYWNYPGGSGGYPRSSILMMEVAP